MKRKLMFSVIAFLLLGGTNAQKDWFVLKFTAVDNATYVQLDSVKVMNHTHGGEYMIYWPDTTLVIQISPGDSLVYNGYATFDIGVGIPGAKQENLSFRLFQNYPNPVKDQCHVTISIPEKGMVTFMVTDFEGRVALLKNQQFEKGVNSFRFCPGNGSFYFLTARVNGFMQSIKIINAEPNNGRRCKLDYIGNNTDEPNLKETLINSSYVKQSGIFDSSVSDETNTFQFATNIPCPGIPTVSYGGQVYNTIQIFNQCWFKENLNVGTMINSSQYPKIDTIIEKYCYGNQPDSCTKYGGLYLWNEMMLYNPQQGGQGICPAGWHIPTDLEWKVLEGAVDSEYGVGDPEWDYNGLRGFDAGSNLKFYTGWNGTGNGNDMYGFSGLPGGSSWTWSGTSFTGIGNMGNWWTSTKDNQSNIWFHVLSFENHGVSRSAQYWAAFNNSVRCLKDN